LEILEYVQQDLNWTLVIALLMVHMELGTGAGGNSFICHHRHEVMEIAKLSIVNNYGDGYLLWNIGKCSGRFELHITAIIIESEQFGGHNQLPGDVHQNSKH